MRLYGEFRSSYVARVAIVAEAKGIQLDYQPTPGGGTGSDEFRALAPLGRIPLLELPDGRVLGESLVIMEYLQALVPQPSLLPDDPFEAARARLVGQIADLYLAPDLLRLCRTHAEGGAVADGTHAALPGTLAGLCALEAHVDGDSYLLGSKLSLADAALAPFFVYAAHVLPAHAPDGFLHDLPRLRRWWDWIRNDPAVARTLLRMARVAPPWLTAAA